MLLLSSEVAHVQAFYKCLSTCLDSDLGPFWGFPTDLIKHAKPPTWLRRQLRYRRLVNCPLYAHACTAGNIRYLKWKITAGKCRNQAAKYQKFTDFRLSNLKFVTSCTRNQNSSMENEVFICCWKDQGWETNHRNTTRHQMLAPGGSAHSNPGQLQNCFWTESNPNQSQINTRHKAMNT